MSLHRHLYRLWLTIKWRKRFATLAHQKINHHSVQQTPGRRFDTLEEQFKSVKNQFGGRSELLFFLYCSVIRARRGQNPWRQAEIIRYCLIEFNDDLFAEMNTRWLVSFLNTIADHGEPREAGAVRSLTTFLHMIKIYETIAQSSDVSRTALVKEAVKYQKSIGRWSVPSAFKKLEIWDYMFIMDYSSGDVIENLLERLNDTRFRVVEVSYQFILQQIVGADLLFTEIMKVNGPCKPLISGDQGEKL